MGRKASGAKGIHRVVILGANGTMGAGSGEVFAAAGCDVTFLARSLEKAREGLITAQELARSERIADGIHLGTYDRDLAQAVGEADLIFEALAEDLELKRDFFVRVDQFRRPDSIVATVSSSLSIGEMGGERSESFRRHFLGIHLFNPPNVMVGTEVIPCKKTSPDVVELVVTFLEERTGRVVIVTADKPAFAGNRVGFKVLNEVAKLAEEHGVAFMDYLVGPYTGRAMAPLATIDLVGWEVHKAIVDNVHAHTHDEARDTFVLPEYMAELIDAGHLGNKTPEHGGFYKLVKANGRQEIHMLNPKKGDYQPIADGSVPRLPFVEKMRELHRVGRYRDAFRAFTEAQGWEADLARRVILGYVSYGLNRVGEVVKDTRDIDRIMAFGFNWAPPSVLVDLMEMQKVVKMMERHQLKIPAVLEQALAHANPGHLFRERNVNIGRFFIG